MPAQQLEGVYGFMWGGMCHVYFMSTAMDSWSGFRVHTVIFHHVSVPLNSQRWSQCLYPEAMRSLAPDLSVCLRLFMSFVCACGGEDGQKNLPKQKVESNTRRKKKWRWGKETEKGWMKRKLITRKQMAPQFTVAPRGPGGTTLCTSGLPALQRGVGRLNTSPCVCTFVC